MSSDEMTNEEMNDFILDAKAQATVPRDGVVFDKGRLDRMAKRASNLGKPKVRSPRKKGVPVPRGFIDEDEKKTYFDEFGPYAMALQDDNERKYFRARKDDIFNSDEFEIDDKLDTNVIMMIIMDEIILQRLFNELANHPQNKSINSQISDVQKRYRSNMHILDATRQQRNADKKDEVREDSLAAIVAQFEKRARERQQKMLEYKREEEELLKQRALKAPVEVDAYGDVIDDDTYGEGDDEQSS